MSTGTTPRRRIFCNGQPAVADLRRNAQVQRRRVPLEKERADLARWMSRLKRAFHAVEKQQLRVSRLEGRLAQFELN